MPADTSRIRLAVTGVVVLSLFAALFARLWYLQVLDTDTFVQAASANQVRFVHEEAPRGRILDRAGRVIVDNRRSQAITVDRSEIAESPEVVGRLAALLGLAVDELERRIADVRFSLYKPVPVAQDVPEEIVVHLREHADEFPGVTGTLLAERAYPHGSTAAHLLGYVGEINDQELRDRRAQGYHLGDSVGKSGVEVAYESDLRGTPGVTKLEVDSRGRVLRVLGHRDPRPGNDVQLAVDLDLQKLVEESLAQGLEAARTAVDREDKKHFAAPAGASVVLDPRDGGVLAMASFPSYDPAAFVNGIKPEMFAALQEPANHFPLNNRAVVGQYAPGSTFKLVTALAAATREMVAANTTITDTGVYTVPRCRGEKCTFRNAGGVRYGRVNLPRSLTVSSDVYYYSLGARFWLERGRYGDGIQDTAREYGFGVKSGVALPTEKAGVIPDPERRERLHDEFPDKFPEGRWFTGDNVNMAIGQGDVLVTPLQLANAYAAFANGGTLYAPMLAARVLAPDGGLVREIGAEVRRRTELAGSVRAPILQGLRGAVVAGEGTAAPAFGGFPSDSLPVAGKTGTAQVARKQDTALFAAFAPLEAPRYSVSVVLEEAGFGGAAAAPVARRIFEALAGQPPGPIRLAEGID